jgi:carbon monoxide dehydrogenase subunit G
MATITRTFTVVPTPDVVVDYLKDFSNAGEWDPGTEACKRLDANPIKVGSRFHNESKIAGVSTELEYTLRELEVDRIVFVGENDSVTSTDTITVKPHADGSEITYEANIDPKGTAGKLADPIMKLLFERVGTKTEQQMTEVLDRLV